MTDELFNSMMQEIDNITQEEYMALCDCTLFSKKPEVMTVKAKDEEAYVKQWGCTHFDSWHCSCKAPSGTKCTKSCMLYTKNKSKCPHWRDKQCNALPHIDAGQCARDCPYYKTVIAPQEQNDTMVYCRHLEDGVCHCIDMHECPSVTCPLHDKLKETDKSNFDKQMEEALKLYGCKWYSTVNNCMRPHWNINDCKKNCPIYTSDKYQPSALGQHVKEALGKKYDSGKARWDLLPMRLIDETVDVITFGAKKYGPNNWQKVEDGKNRYYAALMRHIRAFREGEENDPESGLSHLAHAMCNIIFLSELYNGQ